VESGSAVNLKTNVAEAGYTYEWEYGDGEKEKTDSVEYTRHVYNSPGTYSVSVTVYDAEGKRYGKAQQTVTVQEPQQTPEPTKTEQPKGDPELCGTWQYTSEVYDSDIEGMDYYSILTLQLKEDGTFVYEVKHVYIEPSYPWEQPAPTVTTGTYVGTTLYTNNDDAPFSFEYNNGVLRLDRCDFKKIE